MLLESEWPLPQPGPRTDLLPPSSYRVHESGLSASTSLWPRIPPPASTSPGLRSLGSQLQLPRTHFWEGLSTFPRPLTIIIAAKLLIAKFGRHPGVTAESLVPPIKHSSSSGGTESQSEPWATSTPSCPSGLPCRDPAVPAHPHLGCLPTCCTLGSIGSFTVTALASYLEQRKSTACICYPLMPDS